MSFLDKILGRKQPSTRELQIRRAVILDTDTPRLRWTLHWKTDAGTEPINVLPLKRTEKAGHTVPPREAAQSILLDTLCYESVVDLRDAGYELRLDQIHQLEPEDRKLLGLEDTAGWKMTMDLTGPIGHANAPVALRWTTPGGSYRPDPARYHEVACGYFDTQREYLHILPDELLEIRDTLREMKPQVKEVADEYRMLARLQHQYEQARQNPELSAEITRAGQLENEDFIAPTRVEIDVHVVEDGLELRPIMEGFETYEQAEELTGAQDHQRYFSREITKDGQTRTQRIVLSEQVRRDVARIRQRRHIPRDKITQFLQDPYRYLLPPEEQAQAREERARELGVREDEVFELEEKAEVIDLSSLQKHLDALDLSAFDLSEYGPRVIGIAEAPMVAPRALTRDGLGLEEGYFGAPDNTGTPEETSTPVAPADGPDSGAFEGTDATFNFTEAKPLEAPDAAVPRGVLLTADNDQEVTFRAAQFDKLKGLFEQYGTPTAFQGKLYAHQQVGYAWLRHLHDDATRVGNEGEDGGTGDHGGGGLLADDMGLGKTAQVIALFAHLHAIGHLGPSLLVAPSAVIQNWKEELLKFCPDIQKICEYTSHDRPKNLDHLCAQDIIITTYDTLRIDQLLLGKIRLQVLVIDEAQRIKNYNTGRASACRAMNARLRLALTATPVENTLEDLWSILDFCQPSQLGSGYDFRRNFVAPMNSGELHAANQAARKLQQELRHHYLRRTKEEVLHDILPPKHLHTDERLLTPLQRKLYEQIRHGYAANPGRGRVLNAIQALLRVSAHPLAVTPGQAHEFDLPMPTDFAKIYAHPEQTIQQSAKTAYLFEMLRAIHAKGEKAIIFTEYRALQLLLQPLIESVFDLRPQVINGEVAGNQRHQGIERFKQSEGFDVIIMSAGAAGVGLNITQANHVIHLTREWNPAKEEQATDRAYRIGQQRDVHVYLPIATHPDFDTLDVRLARLLSDKRDLARQVIRPSASLQVSEAELERYLLN